MIQEQTHIRDPRWVVLWFQDWLVNANVSHYLFWISLAFLFNFWGLAALTHFFSFILVTCGGFWFLTSSLPTPRAPFFPLEDSSVKMSSVISLECGFWLCLTLVPFDVFQGWLSLDPWFRCLSLTRRGLQGEFALCHHRHKGVVGPALFLYPNGQWSCRSLCVDVDVFNRDFLRIFKKESVRTVRPERIEIWEATHPFPWRFPQG